MGIVRSLCWRRRRMDGGWNAVFQHTAHVYATMPRNVTALAPEAPIWSAFSALAPLPPLDMPASE